MKFTVGKKSEFGTYHGNTIYDSEGDSVAMVYGLFQNSTLEELQKFPHCEKELKRAYVLAAAPELLEALEYCRMVIDQMSEKAHGKADRVYCMQILKDGNSIDKAIRKARGEE